MLKLAAALAFEALGLLTGCAPMVSLHPLVQDDETTTVDLSYVGLWKECSGDDILKIEQNGDRGYSYQDFGDDSTGQARLVDLEGTRFADIEPKGGVVTAHILARVRLEGDTLYIAFLATAPAAKALPHETVGSGNSKQVVLTASTTDLRRFLLSERNQPGYFDQESSLCRMK